MPKGGSKPGERRGGRQTGARNKATIERERAGLLAAEREKLMLEARANEGTRAIKEAQAAGRKLMKEIGFDLAHLFAGVAAYYQPYGQWSRDPVTGKVANANPNFDESKFKEYAKLAAETARDFAGYETPKLSAVMVGSAVITEIAVTGGLPDEEDGGLIDATANPGGDASRPAADANEGAGGVPDVPSEAGGAVPDGGQAQGGKVRKALG